MKNKKGLSDSHAKIFFEQIQKKINIFMILIPS